MSALTVFKSAKHGGNPILRAIGFLSQICGFLSAGMIFTAVVITCQMIFVRFVLNQSTIWQTEAVVYLMVGATLIGLPYVQKLRGHVNVDLLPLMLPKPLRKALAIFTLGVAIFIIGLMLFYGFDMWYTAWVRGWRSDTIWGVRLWIPYLAVPVGFFLYMLQLAADLLATVLNIEAPFSIDEGEAL
ncbi:TRAP dicarboxylate transporter, DctQ subunit, unknown substrate 4 [hydrothermal vent metagenome]|uniref:Tripartite ATP-independent periplasmic transporters DctQ component domain-containing protein n=1 Tax=hydrothermal vent metagenome TaxID=652676 RepID=A0A3B0TTJ3_9ZZZZ